MRRRTLTLVLMIVAGAAPARAEPPVPRLLFLAEPGQATAPHLVPVLRANLADLAIEVTLRWHALPRVEAAAEAAEAERVGAAFGAALVLWLREAPTTRGRRITLLLADRLTDKTVIRSVTVPAHLPRADLLRLLALKVRGLIHASVLEREQAASRAPLASAPLSPPATVPMASLPAAPSGPEARGATSRPVRRRVVVLEAGVRAASYPVARYAEYGTAGTLRLGGRAYRLVATVEALWQRSDRDQVSATHTLLLPAVGLERVVRAGILEAWGGLQAGVAIAWVRASGPDVVVGRATRVRGMVGAALGAAVHVRWLRVATEVALQAIPGSHGYEIYGTEAVGTSSPRIGVGLSFGGEM